MITVPSIVTAVAQVWDVSELDLRSRRRAHAHPRQVVMYLARNLTELPYGEIGSFLGSRDHTTIMHGVEAVQQQILYDTDLCRRVNTVISKIARSNHENA